MLKEALRTIEKEIRDYGSLQMRLKTIEDEAYALGRKGISLDQALIEHTLKAVEKDVRNIGKYLDSFRRSFNDGWNQYTKEMIDKYSEGYSMDIPR